MTLTDFLLARIAEDEERADRVEFRPYVGEGVPRSLQARVLAECEAKRHIVEVHVPYEPYPGLGVKCETCADNPEADYDGTPMIPWPCGTIKAIARIYADHPDYREEWRP